MYDDRTPPVRRPRAHGGSTGAAPVAVAPRPRDPLWTRVGVIVSVGLLVAPVMAALRGGSDVGLEGQPTGGAIAIVQPGAASATPSTIVGTTPAPATATAAAAPTQDVTVPPAAGDEPAAPAESAGVADLSGSSDESGVAAAAEVAAPEQAEAAREEQCSPTYEVQPGDYWLGIADRAEVSAAQLASVNGLTLDSAIYPGDELCLPAGARYPVPAPPAPTTAPEPTTAPPAATAAPSTTRPPSTTAAPQPPSQRRAPESYTADEVKAIIRYVFPDDQEDRAIEIAWRESNWKPWVYNGHCCYGLFQIYWSVHQSWLDDVGVFSAEDLKDPWLNTAAAYRLYQRSGNSWGPWGG